MAFFIDSTNCDEIQVALDWGWIQGVTTNPTLFKQDEVAQTLQNIAQICKGQIFYQLCAQDLATMRIEAELAQNIIGERLVLKLTPNNLSFRFLKDCASQYATCLTAVYSLTQAALGAQCGATYVAIYIGRAEAAGLDGVKLAKKIQQAVGSGKTRVLAASIKSVETVENLLTEGISDITASFSLLQTLIPHPLTTIAINNFRDRGHALKLDPHCAP